MILTGACRGGDTPSAKRQYFWTSAPEKSGPGAAASGGWYFPRNLAGGLPAAHPLRLTSETVGPNALFDAGLMHASKNNVSSNTMFQQDNA